MVSQQQAMTVIATMLVVLLKYPERIRTLWTCCGQIVHPCVMISLAFLRACFYFLILAFDSIHCFTVLRPLSADLATHSKEKKLSASPYRALHLVRTVERVRFWKISNQTSAASPTTSTSALFIFGFTFHSALATPRREMFFGSLGPVALVARLAVLLVATELNVGRRHTEHSRSVDQLGDANFVVEELGEMSRVAQ